MLVSYVPDMFYPYPRRHIRDSHRSGSGPLVPENSDFGSEQSPSTSPTIENCPPVSNELGFSWVKVRTMSSAYFYFLLNSWHWYWQISMNQLHVLSISLHDWNYSRINYPHPPRIGIQDRCSRMCFHFYWKLPHDQQILRYWLMQECCGLREWHFCIYTQVKTRENGTDPLRFYIPMNTIFLWPSLLKWPINIEFCDPFFAKMDVLIGICCSSDLAGYQIRFIFL